MAIGRLMLTKCYSTAFRHHPQDIDAGAFQDHRADVPGFGDVFPGLQPVLDPIRRSAQGNRIDQRVRHGGGGLVLLAIQIEVLDRWASPSNPIFTTMSL